jgi:hypothetical protein
MAPVVGGAFDSQGLVGFFDRSQLEVIKVLIEQEVGKITMGRRDQARNPASWKHVNLYGAYSFLDIGDGDRPPGIDQSLGGSRDRGATAPD